MNILLCFVPQLMFDLFWTGSRNAKERDRHSEEKSIINTSQPAHKVLCASIYISILMIFPFTSIKIKQKIDFFPLVKFWFTAISYHLEVFKDDVLFKSYKTKNQTTNIDYHHPRNNFLRATFIECNICLSTSFLTSNKTFQSK